MNNGFLSYQIYNATLLHFTSKSYCALKYNYKTKVKYETYLKNKHRRIFADIAKNLDCGDLEKQLRLYYLSQFVYKGVSYIRDMVFQNPFTIDDTIPSYYEDMKYNHENIYEIFEKDIDFLLTNVSNSFNMLFDDTGNKEPAIIKYYRDQKQIQLETLIILDLLVGFDRGDDDDEIVKKKYNPFIASLIDKPRCKDIVLQYYSL